MKFSRNPESGILECYTDDGVFIGNVYTSEPMNNSTDDSTPIELDDADKDEPFDDEPFDDEI